ncbi:acyl-CoA dehydrogenase [Sphaerimonospora mesophila]|uniref:acyl-CoA dehydrogenase n=1 Tax=Sphaerimonospora mesophila TaxID=37483 RepID=UPI0006E430F6
MSRTTAEPPAGLEELFGDPLSPDGAFTYESILAADAQRRLVEPAETLLNQWGFGAELVPVHLGGRWRSTEDLVRRLLPIFRRDLALGLGHGITTFMAAVNVWLRGDERSRHDLAARLLRGERVAVCFHELAHGNDLLQNDCTATLVEDGPVRGWRVDGAKEVINNVERAESALIFARTSDEPGPRSFSLLLWNKDASLAGGADTGRRVLTAGVRGCRLGVIEFDRLVVPEDALIGDVGDGAATALRAFQITRPVVSALAVGTLDAATRLAVPYMRGRALYGDRVWDLPHARLLLTRAWAALLVADAFARTAVRALHVRPDESYLLSAAAKYLVPKLLNDAMYDLSVLFGSSFYTVTSPYGIFEKWFRDLEILPIGHAGSTSCLLSLIPYLPTWARRSRKSAPYEAALFAASADLGELPFAELRLGAGRFDSVTAPLRDEAITSALCSAHPSVARLVDRWVDELTALQDAAAALSPASLRSDASPEAFDLARRLTGVMAVGALLGSWHEGRVRETSPFSRSPVAVETALLRISELLRPAASDSSVPVPRSAPSRVRWPQHLADAAAAHIASATDAGLSLGVEELVTTRPSHSSHERNP